MTGAMVAPEAGRRAESGRAAEGRAEPGRAETGRAEARRAEPGRGTATAGAPAPLLLTVSGLSVSFGPVRALDGVDFSVRTGELVALAGENGAGKTTLVRCVAGAVVPASGEIFIGGKRVPADPAGAAKQGIAVVWQDLALCDNLDVAANIMLGRESHRLMLSDTRFHSAAIDLLASLRIPLVDTTRSVRSLSGGQRQLVAVARAMGCKPRLLALDEPTASLGVKEAAQVEELIMGLRGQGTTILLACHDIDQMFRLADRIVVLRQGRILADLRPADTHPDDVVALLSGQQVDSSARRQLTRLHGLTDRLVSADPSSSLSLILSALGSALSSERLCIHLVSDRALYCAASLGFKPGQLDPWSRLPFGAAGGPVGVAAADERTVIADNVRIGPAWRVFRDLAKTAKVASSWSVPVLGPSGLSGVITVFWAEHGAPQRDELDLVTVYAGYAANAIERDRLLDQVTTRNRVLETIREMLETLAGPVPVSEGLTIAVQSLRRGLQAEEVALITQPAGQPIRWRACAGPLGTDPSSATPSLRDLAEDALFSVQPDGVARELRSSRRYRARAVAIVAAGGPTVLLASWRRVPPTKEEAALMEDAAHSLRLALEREEAAHAHQEAAALRRSRELQRGFLSRLSHELRTPLTAIRGYASSLMQPDVTWDGASQQRFLDRIAAESARLGRLVDDLLDFSAIESGIMRLQPDWCDIRLVLEAAIACLPPPSAASVSLACDVNLPVVWADHDRLEQVFVNLLNNAFGHNPPGTRVHVTATAERAGAGHSAQRLPAGPSAAGGFTQAAPGQPGEPGPGEQAPSEVVISVLDDGVGMPPELAAAPFEAARRPGPGGGAVGGNTAGNGGGNGLRHAGNGSRPGAGGRASMRAGLGLSIARGIVQAHAGRIELIPLRKGTCFSVCLPVEAETDAGRATGSAHGPNGNDHADENDLSGPGDGPAAAVAVRGELSAGEAGPDD
jgi:signal transduction histidine kinase/ABC-type multidrug transport system ATPase subunit